MSKLISEILDIPRPSLAHKIDELEHLSGRPGVDIKLANELKRMFKDKAALLNLDEDDTSAKELYFAMKNHVLENSSKLEKLISAADSDSPKQMIEKAIKFVEKRLGSRTVWALKPSVARKQLKANPPAKLMKIFAIRSIDSALKRERPSVFYCFARFVESKSWVSKYSAQASKLTSSDFDNVRIKTSILSEKRRKQLAEAGVKLNHIIYTDQESAHIEICLPEKRFKGDTLFVIDSLLAHIRNMSRRSEYYKSQSLKPGFNAKIERIRSSGFQSVESSEHPFDWMTLVHASTELGVPGLVQNSDPFVSTEDLLVPSAHQILGLEFWKHPFGMYNEPGIVISFNLSDMIINTINEIPPERAYVDYGRTNLRNELFARYLHHEPVRRKITNIDLEEI